MAGRDRAMGMPTGVARWPGWAFAGMTLAGALLLFQVQPLVSKYILPWFGGCPAVWTTCMLFFQVVLFAGYCYAHLAGRLSLRAQVVVQCALLVLALAVLPIAPSAAWKPQDGEAPTRQILLVLLVTVGLPYFVLSTTSPLVQSWFSRSYPGRSPYRLYALSNIGSLVALLSYPFLVEPAMDLPRQSIMWSAVFVAYVALTVPGFVWVWQLGRRSAGGGKAVAATCDDAAGSFDSKPSLRQRVLWVLLPACASLVLLATTNHACQDVAVVPFLWVVPLALYLLSFILCFDHSRWYVREVWAALAVVLIPVAACADRLGAWIGHSPSFLEQLALFFATMFVICMLCHGELVRGKPSPRYLTEFYLLISAGGALGGVLVSLVAPMIFSSYLEWEIGLVAAYVVALGALVLGNTSYRLQPVRGLATMLVPPLAVGSLLYQRTDDKGLVEQVRNFYGTVSVWRDETAAGPRALLRHGRILHGCQYSAAPASRRATMYYEEATGGARAIRLVQSRRPAMRVGLVGLGVGTLAAYARPGDTYRFYEINPEVERIAEEYFTYLADARQRGARIEMAHGDARLSLERESPQRFDVLVLDAFSGDSIPTHLLTREAMEVYRRHLAPGGVLALHVTNRFLSLAPIVRGLAEEFGMTATRLYVEFDETNFRCHADWMLVSDDPGLSTVLPSSPPPWAEDDFRVPLWTDHFSNLFQILKRSQ